MEKTGDLAVSIDSGSEMVRDNMPYVVRDSQFSVVHQGIVGDQPIALSEGLYSVDVLAPSGAPTSSVVHVQPGLTTHVQVAGPEARGDAPGSGYEESLRSVVESAIPETSLAQGQFTEFRSEAEPVSKKLELLDVNLCGATRLSEDLLEMQPHADLDGVPTALFQLGDSRFVMSLPLNPLNGGRDGACFVARLPGGDAEQLAVLFSPQRDLLSVMFGLLQHGTARSASNLFDAATDLLEGKYVDPAGAALGGLTLHGMGRLADRRRWVQNLADSFGWLPDGQILCAAILSRDDTAMGWQMLVSATENRPMYTDGLSVAMELLRRWPLSTPDAEELRTERLQRLGRLAAHAQWDSIVLMTHGE